LVAVLVGALAWAPSVQAGLSDGPGLSGAQQLRHQAEQCEASGQWSKAGEYWRLLLSKDRGQLEAREHLQLCYRRAQQVRRFQDASYREQIKTLTLSDAQQVYHEVLAKLQASYVERDKVELVALFRAGLEELRLALGDDSFRQEYLSQIGPESIRAFQTRLQLTPASLRRPAEAATLAAELARAAFQELGLPPTLVLLEFACGACSALDEYTTYLTPAQFNEISSAWKGELVGVGIDVTVEDQKLIITQVLPGSAAEAAGLKPRQRITRVGDKLTAKLPLEAVVELLKGQVDSEISLDVDMGDGRPRTVKLRRQVITVASVSQPRFLDASLGIGYLQIAAFQETTVDELDRAISSLQGSGMKVLLLDLRGNLGGLVDVATQVVERFISNGLIVATHGQERLREFNMRYEAHGMNSVAVPVVVLVDYETASAAEIVAAALKDHQRGTLVGQTTFGKGCIQKVRKLSSVPAGIRMTVAKFYSPRGLAISGAGVAPHLLVESPEMPVDLEQDAQVKRALEVAQDLLMGR
jgi:carboxyl-terminal processing protease